MLAPEELFKIFLVLWILQQWILSAFVHLKSLYFTFILKDLFKNRSLDWLFYSFKNDTPLFWWDLCCSLIFVLNVFLFSLPAFKILSLIFSSLTMMYLGVCGLFLEFILFVGFMVWYFFTISQKFFVNYYLFKYVLYPVLFCFYFWNFHYMYVGLVIIVTLLLDTLFWWFLVFWYF